MFRADIIYSGKLHFENNQRLLSALEAPGFVEGTIWYWNGNRKVILLDLL